MRPEDRKFIQISEEIESGREPKVKEKGEGRKGKGKV